MPLLRPITISILISIFLLIGIYLVYNKLNKPPTASYVLSSDRKWIGVVDMDFDHGINIDGILNGHDVLIVVDHRNFFFRLLQARLPQAKYTPLENLFDIALFDENQDGLLNEQDLIYRHLYVIVFHANGEYYEIKPIALAGIRAIKVKHLTPTANHTVILSDGSERTLYEIKNHNESSPVP